MARLTHPRLEDVPLELVLYALADPARLAIVALLAGTGATSCSNSTPSPIPKSTLSNHLKTLRAAGLIESTQIGREIINRLRRAEFDVRFPGLLYAVLANRPGGETLQLPGDTDSAVRVE